MQASVVAAVLADGVQRAFSGVSLRGPCRRHERYPRKNRALFFLFVALNIKDNTADELVRELASATGESITTAVTVAVRERLERVRGVAPAALREQELIRIARQAAARPERDHRSPDEIVGYDRHGLPA